MSWNTLMHIQLPLMLIKSHMNKTFIWTHASKLIETKRRKRKKKDIRNPSKFSGYPDAAFSLSAQLSWADYWWRGHSAGHAAGKTISCSCLVTTRLENPASRRYLVGKGSRAFFASRDRIGLLRTCAQNCDQVTWAHFCCRTWFSWRSSSSRNVSISIPTSWSSKSDGLLIQLGFWSLTYWGKYRSIFVWNFIKCSWKISNRSLITSKKFHSH